MSLIKFIALQLITCLGFFSVSSAFAEVRVEDDIGQLIILESPARRVISLAPHTTELLFDAGATDQLKGVVSFSDYPEQAKTIRRIGSYNQFDLEAITALKPDLIVAWQEGNTMARINQVMSLGVPVFVNEPRTYEDIETSILKFGKLLGTENKARQRAEQYTRELARLKQANNDKSPVRVFYQVWDKPLYTVNGQHLISRVIDFCSGINVFHQVSALSPQIGIESVLQRDPEVIVAGMAKGREHWLDDWKQWSGLQAVRNQQLYAINADLIVRHTPRILQGTQQMCDIFDQVRSARKKISN